MGKKAATYAELEALPPQLVGEILDGELVVSPRPAPRHAWAATQLAVDIGGRFGRGDGPGGWVILGEPELHLGPQVLVPDLAGWRKERLPSLPATGFFESSPDWVCEVLSPATAQVDRARKMHLYARAQVGHAWLIDPVARTLEVFRWDDEGWRAIDTYAGDQQVRPEPFEAVPLDLGNLWAR